MNIKLCYFQKNCIVFPTKLESQIESLLHTLGAHWSHNQRNMRYYKDAQYYRLTNVDNLKKRFKVNKTELETKYYDV